MSLEFREIDRAHFPQWKRMRSKLYTSLDDDFHVKEMDGISQRADWYCRFIANSDGEFIGLLELSSRNVVDGCLASPVAYLEGLYLEPEYRGQGVGKSVLGMVVSWCRRNGYSELATDTELHNKRVQQFYTSFGFEEQDRVVTFRMTINE